MSVLVRNLQKPEIWLLLCPDVCCYVNGINKSDHSFSYWSFYKAFMHIVLEWRKSNRALCMAATLQGKHNVGPLWKITILYGGTIKLGYVSVGYKSLNKVRSEWYKSLVLHLLCIHYSGVEQPLHHILSCRGRSNHLYYTNKPETYMENSVEENRKSSSINYCSM